MNLIKDRYPGFFLNQLMGNLYPEPLTKKPVGLKIPHTPGDPSSFDEYFGQESIKARIILRLGSIQRGESFKALFSASAGQGKTSLARIIARDMGERNLIANYYETVAGQFEIKQDLDRFIAQIPDYSLIFIDEIHGLGPSVRDALLPAIQDNVYPFNDGVTLTPLPTGISWIGATTDLGKVHAALQRRLLVITLEPMSWEDRATLAMALPKPMTELAACEIATRCWTPWEIKDELYLLSKDIAKQKKAEIINLDHVLEACDLLGVDKNGLRPRDRAVLGALFAAPRTIKDQTRYGMSARALMSTVGIDAPTFYDVIEPKLLRLGYLRIASGIGRELTEKAIKDYFNE